MRAFFALSFVTVLIACGSSSDTPPPEAGFAPPAACGTPQSVTGHATWYDTSQSPSGACGIAYAAHPNFGAMNETDFRGSAACGVCVDLTYKGKTLNVTIVDLCPYKGNETWCGPGGHHIDLGRNAFAFFLDPGLGVLDVTTWKYAPCTVTGAITYTWKAESSEYWAELLIGNYPYEIATVEYKSGDNWVALTRTGYGYFQASGGMGPGPYTLRVTDVNGGVVTDTGMALAPGGTVQGAANFGLCP
jgi:expansin